jgi:hypothetical protein
MPMDQHSAQVLFGMRLSLQVAARDPRIGYLEEGTVVKTRAAATGDGAIRVMCAGITNLG